MSLLWKKSYWSPLSLCYLKAYCMISCTVKNVRDPRKWSICFYTREYWMIYRGPGFLAVIRLLPRPFLRLMSASCLSYSVFLWDAGRAYWREKGVGEEPNHTTARKKPGPLSILSVLYSTMYCTYVPKYLRKWRKEDWRGALWQFPSSYPRSEQVPAACKQTRRQNSNHLRFRFLRKRFPPNLWLTDRKKAVNHGGYLIKRQAMHEFVVKLGFHEIKASWAT